MVDVTDKRFTEEEFAEILRKATELQSRSLVPSGGEPAAAPQEGMSLEEIKAIAAEVGIDREAVERAAGLVVQREESRPTASRYVLVDSAPGKLSDEDKVRLLQAVRDATAQHGSGNVSTTGLEWSSKQGELTQYNVTVHHLDGRNEVRVGVDRSVADVLTHFFPTAGGFLSAVAIGASLEPSLAVGLPMLGAGAAVGFGLGRLLWTVTGRKVRSQAEAILSRVTRALPEATESPSHESQEDDHG
jgi:hypothetical protein